MFEVEYVLISCVCLYKTLDSKCHELKYGTPKFDGVYFFYISLKFIAFMNVWNLVCINLFNFLIFQLDGIFCSCISQFGASHKHASSPWTCCCASIDGSNWLFVEVCAKVKCFYV
jgi:hypothetical protein